MSLREIVKAGELINKLRIVKIGEMHVVQYNILGYWHDGGSYGSFREAENIITYLKDNIKKQGCAEVVKEYNLGVRGMDDNS